MKIFVICSKHFYGQVSPIKEELERMGHIIQLPNSFDAPMKEEEMKQVSPQAHIEWKKAMLRMHIPNIQKNDAVLVLNFEKHGQQNYIGGATFLEISKAFDLDRRIFMYNPIPDSIFRDELIAMEPLVINGDLSLVI